MNELKSVYIDRTGDWVRSGNDTGKFYLKEEVDRELESLKATHYAEMVDAGMRERRLRRLLWHARARNARNMKAYENLDNYTSNHQSRNSRWNYISSQRYDCWFYAWEKVERKCRAKMEEYK